MSVLSRFHSRSGLIRCMPSHAGALNLSICRCILSKMVTSGQSRILDRGRKLLTPLVCPPFSSHSLLLFFSLRSPFPQIFPILCLRPVFAFPSFDVPLWGPLPIQLRGLGSAVSSPADPNGARPTKGFWCIPS